jgi:hypothetical protein
MNWQPTSPGSQWEHDAGASVASVHHRAIASVTLAQLSHEVGQMGRQLGFDRRQALLQAFANGVADRPTGLVVDEFEAAVDSAIHGEIHVAWSNGLMRDQVAKTELVARAQNVVGLTQATHLCAGAGFHRIKKSPGAWAPGQSREFWLSGDQ